MQCREVMKAIEYFKDYQFIITGANADCGGNLMNQMFSAFAEQHQNVYFSLSLGMKAYLSALSFAAFVLGNSSSGLMEAPSFKIPTINVGNRQKGRIKADSVIDCQTESQDIIQAVKYAMSDSFKEHIVNCVNPYGDGNTTKKIVQIVKDELMNKDMNLQKKFYDLSF